MNICLLGYPEVTEDNFGNGIAKVVFTMTDYFRKRGNTVLHYHLFSRKQYKELNSFLVSNRIDVAIWHMSTLKIRGRLHLPCPLICMWHNSPLGQLSDYIDTFCVKYHVGKFLSSCLHLKLISVCMSALHNSFNQVMFSYVTYCADKYVLLSDGFKKGFLPARLFPKKVVSIPNGLVIDEAFDCQEMKKNNRVLFVGRLRKEKRVDYLLKGWEIVEKAHDDWSLVIVGDGPDGERYKLLAKELGLKHCEWQGWQKDPTPWMKNSKVIAMTSEYEGFPLVLVEASQYGTVPVIFDSFAAAEDIIADGVNGKLIAPFDINAFAKGLTDLMENPQMLENMSNEARENVKRYDINQVMKRWSDLICEVLRNRR